MLRQSLATLLLGWLGLAFVALAKGDEQSLPAINVEAPRLYPYESTINRQALDRESANDMGQALSAMPGVAKIRKGGIANDVVVRGFYRDNISVLTDNQKLFGACPNRMDPPAFHTSLAEIESVTVIKGPFDIRHQGSMGGSVAIITKSHCQDFMPMLTCRLDRFLHSVHPWTFRMAKKRLLCRRLSLRL